MNYDGYIKYDNDVAKSYDKDRKEEEHWNLENTYIQNRYSNKKIARILDLPVGTGRFLKYYEKITEVHGCDISEDMLNVAKSNSLQIGNISLTKEDAFNLSFTDNYFNEIVCFRLLHLIPSNLRKDLLEELLRVVKEVLILQLYVSKELTIIEKIINKVKSILSIKSEINTDAWKHIQAYSLNEKELNDLITMLPVSVVNKEFLCKYGGSSIYVLELSKN